MSNFEQLSAQIEQGFQEATTLEALNTLRVEYLGKKGKIADLMKQMKQVPKEEKKAYGQAVNALKAKASELFEAKKAVLEQAALEAKLASENIDLTLPGRIPAHGNLNHLHLIE